MYCSCSMNEIKQEKNPSWQKMPVTMAIKTATVRACRDAFPEDLGGLYEQDEISKTIDNSGFTDEDIKEFDVDTETGEVKEENVIDIEEL